MGKVEPKTLPGFMELMPNDQVKFNEMKEDKSVYFYFLMKVGFNGVYRENKKGFFNVPFGRKEKFIVNENDLFAISKLIKNEVMQHERMEDLHI